MPVSMLCLSYPSGYQVYFVGRSGAPKIKGNPHLAKVNYGYDEERGDYICVMHDHLAYRFACFIFFITL